MSEHLFNNGEKVLVGGKIVTVKKWGRSTQLGQFTYRIIEYPNTFYIESELSRIHPDTITLKRIYSTHCQVCGEPFSCATPYCKMPIHKIVYFVPLDNNIVCLRCAAESGLEFEPRIYKEGE